MHSGVLRFHGRMLRSRSSTTRRTSWLVRWMAAPARSCSRRPGLAVTKVCAPVDWAWRISSASSGSTPVRQIGTGSGTSWLVVRCPLAGVSMRHVNEVHQFCTRLRSGQIGAFPHGLFLARAKGISKESGGPALELPPKGWRTVEDGTAAVITKDLFHARDSGRVFLVLDAVNPLIATITIKGRFYLRGQHFHFEFNLRSSRPSEFGSPSLWPKRNI